MKTVDRNIELVQTSDWGSRWRFLVRDLAVYGMASMASRLITLFSFPILTRYLSSENYGITDLLMVVGNVLTLLCVMGQDSALARFFYETEDLAERRRVVSQALALQIAWCALILFSLVLAFPLLTQVHPKLLGHERSCAWLLASLPLVMLANFNSNLAKWTFDRWGYVFLSAGGAAAIAIGGLVGAVALEFGVEGFFAGSLAGSLLFAVLGLWRARTWLVWPCGSHLLKALALFGWPCMGTALLSAALALMERGIVLSALGDASLGAYAAGARIASLILLPITAFQMAWNPMCLAIYKQAEAGETYSRVLLWKTAILVVAAVVMHCLAAPVIAMLASDRYLSGAVVVGPLVLGQVFRSLCWVAGIGVELSKKTYLTTSSQIIGYIFAVATAAVLAPSLGIALVAWCMMAGHVIAGGVAVALARRVHPVRVRISLPALIFALGVGIVGYFSLRHP